MGFAACLSLPVPVPMLLSLLLFVVVVVVATAYGCLPYFRRRSLLSCRT